MTDRCCLVDAAQTDESSVARKPVRRLHPPVSLCTGLTKDRPHYFSSSLAPLRRPGLMPLEPLPPPLFLLLRSLLSRPPLSLLLLLVELRPLSDPPLLLPPPSDPPLPPLRPSRSSPEPVLSATIRFSEEPRAAGEVSLSSDPSGASKAAARSGQPSSRYLIRDALSSRALVSDLTSARMYL